MTLEEYTTIEEKGEFFKNGEVKIDTGIDEMFDKLRIFKEKGTDFIFRGSSEAKYRLYSSAQRLYINQELHRQVSSDKISEHYIKFVEGLIDNCKSWNNGVVSKLLQNSGIDENNAVAYLSYMQHFGVPTPFLDYSYNPYVALFFAIDNLSYTASDNEIDNYFSLYYTFTNSTIFERWRYVFNDKLKKEDISYKSIDSNSMSIILPDEELYKIINSVNIINQEGLFFYNNHPWYPLERTYNEYIVDVKEEIGEEAFKKLLSPETISGCFNIHKSLIPAIKKKLNELGINDSYIYPDMSDFRKSVTNNGILNSLTK